MGSGDSERTRQADESLARSFSLAMNASTSRWGLLCDIPFSSAAASVGVLLLAIAAHHGKTLLALLAALLALVPVVVCVSANVALRGARSRLVTWLASLPFPIENMNSILAGLGEGFEIHFAEAMPTRDEVMEFLTPVSDDVFVLEVHDEDKLMVSRLGVDVNKHLSTLAGWRRFERMRRVILEALVPLHQRYPIALVRVV